jgi:hypothetical protein
LSTAVSEINWGPGHPAIDGQALDYGSSQNIGAGLGKSVAARQRIAAFDDEGQLLDM